MFSKGPVVGKMTDDLGPRIPVLIGSFLHVFGLMMTSLSKEYYQIFLAQSICSAMGCSFLFYARKLRQVLVFFYMLNTNSYRRPGDVVPSASGFRVRYCNSRVQSWGCRSSYNGQSSGCVSRLRLGYAIYGISFSRTLNHRKSHGQDSTTSTKAAVQVQGFHCSIL